MNQKRLLSGKRFLIYESLRLSQNKTRLGDQAGLFIP
jgi:hypothetical protein